MAQYQSINQYDPNRQKNFFRQIDTNKNCSELEALLVKQNPPDFSIKGKEGIQQFSQLTLAISAYNLNKYSYKVAMKGKGKEKRNSRKMRLEQLLEEKKSFNILRYETFDTLKMSDEDGKSYIDTDENFVEDVHNVAKIRKNMVLNMLTSDKKVLTDQDCDQIDYQALLHREANIVNSTTNLNFEQITAHDRCDCGCKRGRGDPIPYCTNEQTLNILGPGVLLMFLFKRAIFVILGMIMVVYGTYALTTNLIGSSAIVDKECAKSSYCVYKHEASNENKEERRLLYVIQFWLGLSFSVIWIITLRFIKFMGEIKNDEVDKKLRSASDYAVKIENLPAMNYSEEELLDFLDGLWGEVEAEKKAKSRERENFREDLKSDELQINHFKMKSIQIIYNMEFARKMIEQISILCCSIDGLLSQPDGKKRNVVRDVELYRKEKTRLKKTYELLMDLRKRFLNDPQFRKKLSTSVCIIEFSSQKKRKELLKYFGIEKIGVVKKLQMKVKRFFFQGAKDLIFKGNVLRIERAPEPSDILWINCEKEYKLRRILAIYSATFLIVVLSFGMLIGLEYLQNFLKQGKFDNENVLTIVNIAMSVSLLIVNKLLWFSLFYLLEIEYNHTLTEKIISQMNKVLLASSVNVIALPIISNIIINRNLYGSDGLSGMVFDYHIGVMAGLAIKLFDPLFLIKKLVIGLKSLRNLCIRFLCGNVTGIEPRVGVKAVNEFYEGEYFDVAENYVYIIGAIVHAAFFCYLQPFIIILVTIMVLLFYFINRLKILRYCRIPEMTELLVFETALSQAALVPIMYGAGSLVIAFIERESGRQTIQMPYVSSFISIFVGLIGIFNPGGFLNKIVKKIMKLCKCLVVVPSERKQEDDEEESEQEEEEESQKDLAPRVESTHNYGQAEVNLQEGEHVEPVKDELAVGDKEKTSRIQVYYENSNSLTLLGFEKILKYEDAKALMGELENFCKSFFPSSIENGKQIAAELAFDFFIQNDSGKRQGQMPMQNEALESGRQEEPLKQEGQKKGNNLMGSLFAGKAHKAKDVDSSQQDMLKKIKNECK